MVGYWYADFNRVYFSVEDMSDSPTLKTLQLEIEYLQKAHEENADDIKKLKGRLEKYDLLAARWGGVCMFAAALGTAIMTFSDKVSSFLKAIITAMGPK